MSVAPMKQTLLRFKYSRDLKDLLHCAFTTGLAYLIKYLRGVLAHKDFQLAGFYAKRMKKMLGITLPHCWHPMVEADSETYVKQAEQEVINQVIQKMVDEEPLNGDVLDGPTWIHLVFHEQALFELSNN